MEKGVNVTVKENNREMVIIIPPMSDKSHQQALIEEEVAKTKEQLRKKPPRVEHTPEQKKEFSGAMKEKLEYLNRKKKGTGKRYW